MPKFCGNCGSPLDERTGLCPNCDKEKLQEILNKAAQPSSGKFCGNCGAPLSEDGLCPNCDHMKTEIRYQRRSQETSSHDDVTPQRSRKEAKRQRTDEKKRAKQAEKKERWRTLPFGQKVKRILLRFFILLLVTAILAGAAVFLLDYYEIIHVPAVDKAMMAFGWKEPLPGGGNGDSGGQGLPEGYEPEERDADSFYEENGNLLSEISAKKSPNVHSESEAINNLENRGFVDYPITTEFNMDGEYGEFDVSGQSSQCHPSYQTYYISSSGELWTIFEINGVVMANPVSYNMQSTRGVQLIISESDSVVSYDSTTNKFYETIPEESVLIVKKADRIDADTLDALTIEVIDKL